VNRDGPDGDQARSKVRRSNRSISRSGNPRCPDFPPFLMRILKRQIVSDSARHGPPVALICVTFRVGWGVSRVTGPPLF